MGPNQPLTELMSWFFPGGKVARAHSLFRAKVKNEWSSSSATPYAFMLWTGIMLPLNIFKNFILIVGLEIGYIVGEVYLRQLQGATFESHSKG